MTYNLIVSHFDPVEEVKKTKVFVLHGDTMQDILDKIEAHPLHIANLRKHGRTSMKDGQGVVHTLLLKEVVGPH